MRKRNVYSRKYSLDVAGGACCFSSFFAGVLLCVTIIGIPFGIQCIKLSFLSLMPFGKEIVDIKHPTGCLSILMNVLWICVGGVWIALMHLFFGLLYAVTIIDLPSRSSI